MLADFNEKGLAETVAELEVKGTKVVSLVGDIAEESHSEELVALAVKTFGK